MTIDTETYFQPPIGISMHRLSYLQKKSNYAGIKYFNQLPYDIKTIYNIDKFGEKTSLFLVGRPLYSWFDLKKWFSFYSRFLCVVYYVVVILL